ncbi:phospholipid/cholesterol/gamma-HCH transport system permease protein [Humitalea rosea]|uniref:Phospholipid/cholesterol/gamma-HCH transport system permease protein n=1 Tax=Humitalea rosea TaxID=990373 RepID=A0A2W7IN69_9PROT|nr:ABC transporter permease [Humitalea rosea]PZW48358.1 phospholipid/cholesterol/gamma-HCH transport system permease protein [Humitalea rosea]
MTAETLPAPAPSLTQDGTRLVFAGRLDAAAAASLWRPAKAAAEAASAPLELDLSAVEVLDTNGATLLLRAGGEAPRTTGASPAVAAVLARAVAAAAAPGPAGGKRRRFSPLAMIGAAAFGIGDKAAGWVAFLGEAAVTIGAYAVRPRGVRFGDLMRHLDEAGTRAFGLCILLGSLLGVILAFQSSIPMRQFGAEIFIPKLVGISLLRELGPLMAAIILAGRTGSAYAAELGTMTVNEEVDALKIMGIDPMRMLVLPRLLAGTLVMPVLALLLTLAGLIGMGAVMVGLGFPPTATMNQLSSSLTLGDMIGGLGKAACFGLAIAGIGCRSGLSAGRGPQAVGDAATGAVVGGIVSIVVLDGIFAVLFFRLGW